MLLMLLLLLLLIVLLMLLLMLLLLLVLGKSFFYLSRLMLLESLLRTHVQLRVLRMLPIVHSLGRDRILPFVLGVL